MNKLKYMVRTDSCSGRLCDTNAQSKETADCRRYQYMLCGLV